MENTMVTTIMGYIETTGYILGLERITEKMETTIMGYIGTTIRIHSFLPS